MENSSINVWRLILLSIIALLNLSPSWITAWSYDHEGLSARGMSFAHTQPIEPLLTARIEGMNFCLELIEQQAAINFCDKDDMGIAWQSPADWDVREAFFSDLNRDGVLEATLLVWREFQSWPVDRFLPSGGRIDSFQDSNGRSCHVILIGMKDGGFKEVWAGSAMADPLHQIHAADLDEDGVEELAGLEYPYNGNDHRSSLVVWEWNGFGFTLGDRKTGSYSTLQIIFDQQNKLLVVQ